MIKPLPPDWRRVRLGDVLEQVRRFEPLKPDHEYQLLGVKWYAEGVFERERRLGRAVAARQLNRVEAGDFLYNRLFAWKGSFAVVGSGYAGGYVSGEFPVFRAKPGTVLEEFIYRYFSRPQVWKQIEHQSTGTTSVSRNRWKEEQFFAWHISLPPLREQERIVAILRAVEEAIKANEEVIARTRDLKTALGHEVLTHGLPGRHTRFKESPIGEIPAEWEMRKLGELLIRIEAGKSPKCEDHPAGPDEWGVLKVSAISSGQYLPQENKVAPSTMLPIPEIEVHAGDVLVVCANGVADLVGRAAYVEQTLPRLMLSDKTLRLIPDLNKLDASLIPLLLASTFVRAQIESLWGGSSGQKNISQDSLRRVLIPVPPISEQRQMAETLRAINHLEKATQQAISFGQETRSMLMESLLNGYIRGLQ
ncbi:MAG: restriction endonuclease subunit S [Candidatus Entotheonellia bacterium]